MTTIKKQKQLVTTLKQMVFEEEHNDKVYKKIGLDTDKHISKNCPDLKEELKKEEKLRRMERET